MSGFRAALILGGVASTIGMIAAVFAPGRRQAAEGIPSDPRVEETRVG